MLSPSCKALQHFTQVNINAQQSICSAPMRTSLRQCMPAHASSSSCFNSTDINVTLSFQVIFCFAATFSQLNAQQVNLFTQATQLQLPLSLLQVTPNQCINCISIQGCSHTLRLFSRTCIHQCSFRCTSCFLAQVRRFATPTVGLILANLEVIIDHSTCPNGMDNDSHCFTSTNTNAPVAPSAPAAATAVIDCHASQAFAPTVKQPGPS